MKKQKFEYDKAGDRIHPLVKCPVCGREHRRNNCPFCRKAKKWQEMPISRQIPELPVRITEELQKYNFPPEIWHFPGSYYLHGKAGGGKTLLAAKILYEAKRLDYIEIKGGEKYKTFAFTTALGIIQEIKDTYNGKSNTTEGAILEKYKNIDWLVIDDISVEKTTDWSFQVFYQIINHRYENYKQTIFTSNFSLEQLPEKMNDERIPRRIHAICTKDNDNIIEM